MSDALAAITADADCAASLYRAMRTDELRHLRSAFRLDQAQATRPDSIAFGAGRIALIDAELKKRGEG